MTLEEIKKKARKHKKVNKTLLVTLLIFIFLTILFFLIYKGIGFVLFGLDIVLIVVYIVKISENRNDLVNEIFRKCILPRLEESFKEFKYDNLKGLDTSLIRELNLIDTADRVSTSNMIEGIYRDVSFVCSGVRCYEKEIHSDGDTTYRPTFNGRLYVIGKSVLESEGYVDIIDCNYSYFTNHVATRKATLNHSIEGDFDIFVSNPKLSLPMSFLNCVKDLKEMHPNCFFNIRVCEDRIYMFVDKINIQSYDVAGDLEMINEEQIDLIIKKDSCFFTNIISCILDSKGDK